MTLNKIKDNSIVICPFTKKNSLIKLISKENPYLHVKFMSKEELLEGVYFTYGYDALHYVSKTYGYNYNNAEEILENLKGIRKYNEKLDELKNIYDDLFSKFLLKYNPVFKHLFNNKYVYVYGYSSKDIELKEALKKITTNYEYISEIKENVYSHFVYKFNEIEEEVTYVFDSIAKLVENGVSLNNIYLYNYSSEYELIIKKYMYYYNFVIELEENMCLYDSPIYIKYIDLLESFDYQEAYTELTNQVLYDEYKALEKLAQNIVDIKELNLDKKEFIELLNYISKKTKLENTKYKQAIKICNHESILNDDDYVFMLGFSLGNYPTIKRDTDFFSDEEKLFLGKNTSSLENEMLKEQLINFIQNIKNLTITYKEKIGKTVYYPSLLIEELEMPLIEGVLGDFRYSERLSRIEVAKYKDNSNKYGIDNEYLFTFSDEELNYRKYDYHFKNIDDYNNDKELILSFSQIDNYNKCHFKYYVEKVLKINEYEDNFYARLGDLFHKILEDSIRENIELETYKYYINDHFKTQKELYFVEKLLPQIKDVLVKNKEFDDNTFFKEKEAEKVIYSDIDEKTKLMGKIDKISKDKSSSDLAVVDYKTSKFEFDEKKVKYGLNLQLPIYSVLLKSEYPKYNIAGMYIQNVLKDPFDIKNTQPYYLAGLSLRDGKVLKRLDYSLGRIDENGDFINCSKFVSKIRVTKEGEPYAQGPFKSKEEMETMVENTKAQIKEIVENIRKGNFNISPIKYKKERFLPCDLCSYKDICFMKKTDIITVGNEEGDENDEI